MFVWFRHRLFLIQTRSVFLVYFWSRHSVFSHTASGCYKLHQIRLQYLLSQVSTCFFRKVSLSLSLCHLCIFPLPLWFFFTNLYLCHLGKSARTASQESMQQDLPASISANGKKSEAKKSAIQGISLMLTLIFAISMLTTTVTPKGKKCSKSSGRFYSLPTGMNSLGIWVWSQKNFGHLQR